MVAAVGREEFGSSRAGLELESDSSRDAENDEDRQHSFSRGDDGDLTHALKPSLSDSGNVSTAPRGYRDDLVVSGAINAPPINGITPHAADDAAPDTSDTPPVAGGSGFSILPGGRGSASRKPGRPLLF